VDQQVNPLVRCPFESVADRRQSTYGSKRADEVFDGKMVALILLIIFNDASQVMILH